MTVAYEVEDHVAQSALDRPEARSGVEGAMIRAGESSPPFREHVHPPHSPRWDSTIRGVK